MFDKTRKALCGIGEVELRLCQAECEIVIMGEIGRDIEEIGKCIH